MVKKRGRPAGTKNKPQGLEKQTAHWEGEPRKPAVDWRELAQKLQNELAKTYVEVQRLEKKLYKANIWLNIKQKRINDYEDLLAQAIQAGDIEMGHNEDMLDQGSNEDSPV